MTWLKSGLFLLTTCDNFSHRDEFRRNLEAFRELRWEEYWRVTALPVIETALLDWIPHLASWRCGILNWDWNKFSHVKTPQIITLGRGFGSLRPEIKCKTSKQSWQEQEQKPIEQELNDLCWEIVIILSCLCQTKMFFIFLSKCAKCTPADRRL